MILLSLLTVSGCVIYTQQEPMTSFYYFNEKADLDDIGKVVLVELTNNSTNPTISSTMTETIYQALQKKQLFSISIMNKDDIEWERMQIDDITSYNYQKLAKIRKSLKCDAILFGTITEYHPYPHMTMGLRLKMINVKDGQLVWAVEDIWDTSDNKTEYRIERYFNLNSRSDLAPLHKELMTVSPIKFQKFVAYEVAQTLNNNEMKYSSLY